MYLRQHLGENLKQEVVKKVYSFRGAVHRIKKPIVWTFHDMWPFCGAEHVSYDERYITGYTERNRPPGDSGFDLNRWVWNRKMKAFRSLQNLSIVCPSDWLAECVERSLIFRGRNIYVVPNGLDTNVFCPMERSEVRRELNLPADRTILLFGAMDSTAEKNKGYHLLMATLNILATNALKDKLQLVVFGNRITLPNELMGIPIRGFGMISDDSLLATLYSAADVTIVPSLIESFGQTASESLACGTPVACFDTSGLKSVVDHRENGYRAKCYSPEDRADGILWICADSGRHRTLSEAGRRKAETHFGLDRLAAGYAKVYDDLLSQSKRK
jgi:glycosyltransferase involved in cell wall biosynthesis